MGSIFNGCNFQWLYGWKQCVVSPRNAGKSPLFWQFSENCSFTSVDTLYMLYIQSRKKGETRYSKCLLNADVIYKLTLQKQEMPPLPIMIWWYYMLLRRSNWPPEGCGWIAEQNYLKHWRKMIVTQWVQI